MKASCGNGLRGIVVLALLFGGRHASAQSQPPTQPHSALSQQAATPPSAPNSEQTAPASASVSEVRVVTDTGKVLAQASVPLPAQAGKPLDRAKIAESLRILFRTGNYSNVG